MRTKTIKRPKHKGRIVITLEAAVIPSEVPASNDGVDVLRERLRATEGGLHLPIDEIRAYLDSLGITVDDYQVEASK
jgi:hypothetical protein